MRVRIRRHLRQVCGRQNRTDRTRVRTELRERKRRWSESKDSTSEVVRTRIDVTVRGAVLLRLAQVVERAAVLERRQIVAAKRVVRVVDDVVQERIIPQKLEVVFAAILVREAKVDVHDRLAIVDRAGLAEPRRLPLVTGGCE